MSGLFLYDTLRGEKVTFEPHDKKHVRMYVCGPTVYDAPHLGNARSAVVYDLWFRVLSALYPKVTYVRNITDVDDKIIAAAKQNKEPIAALTKRMTEAYHSDMQALNLRAPSLEPKVTSHIGDIVKTIEALIENGHAYVAEKHVLFSVKSDAGYGRLSKRDTDDQRAGARVEVESYKRDAGDFILWKPADAEDDASSIFESPWGKGRPGWHIECTSMAQKLLGADFDIHGGGADLKFPHHENEIAQALGACPHSHYAKYWIHNGFLMVEGEKMSKSLGNFITVRQLLDEGVKGEVIRFLMLQTHYRKPLDFTRKGLEEAERALDKFYHAYAKAETKGGEEFVEKITAALSDDLNVPLALSILHDKEAQKYKAVFAAANALLGIFESAPEAWFGDTEIDEELEAFVEAQIAARVAAKKAKEWAKADAIRAELKNRGIVLEDKPDGTTIWRAE